ncbi:aldo/keto reductase, partial [Selenomonas ruminantium]|uniref:aldo/keto reductase n=1 Tax=Selenomonas ruminantium TaxID=971 RepID=UPI0026F2DC70
MYLGEQIKKLGFGLMRLPKKGEEIDVEQVKVMVDKFLAAGFTYFDTAWAYAGSEDAIRQALVERYPREKFQLATKNAAWINCKTREEAIEQFNLSLKRTGAGYFDFYLLHNLGESRTKFFDDFDMWSFVQEKKAEGLIKHVGFSFHSTPEELEEILTKHPEMEFVQLQINYGDWENPAIQSRACYEVARKHGKPVIIMEPVKGGMLANPPESVKQILQAAEPESSCASWAIRFAADLEGLIVVLSGMSNVEQMEDNLSYMKDFTGLTESQKDTINKAREALAKIPVIPCTTCNYCAKVCPKEIGISGTFTAMNYLTLYGDKAAAQHQENWLVGGHGRKKAAECIKCG